MQYLTLCKNLIKSDLLLAIRNPHELINPLLFYGVIILLFGLTLGSDAKLLADSAVIIIWIVAMLASLLSLNQLWRIDLENGHLEQLLLSPHALPWLISSKIIAHWLSAGSPIILFTPIFALLLSLPLNLLMVLLATLCLGSLILSLVGGFAMGLLVGLRNPSFLLTLIVLPLYVPVLLLGVGAVLHKAMNMNYSAELALLGAILIVASMTLPFLISAALKIGIKQ